MQKSYIIIDFSGLIDENLEDFESLHDLICVGYYTNPQLALNGIIDLNPHIIFFHFSLDIQLTLIAELNYYLEDLPYIIAVHSTEDMTYKALKYGISDYLLFPLQSVELKKALLKFNKLNSKIAINKLCIRSNGDHHFIPFENIVYLKADNNTTDFFLANDSIVPAFKTLKSFENQLPFYFFRIHNSYIININYITRINSGKLQCYLLDNKIKIPFSRTYKKQVDLIIKRIG